VAVEKRMKIGVFTLFHPGSWPFDYQNQHSVAAMLTALYHTLVKADTSAVVSK
jgi:hypothetical protein